MINTIEFKNKIYPQFQSVGFASQFAIPYAQHVCNGVGYDIGCMKPEWALPGSIPIDLTLGSDGLTLPAGEVDYIFSSHCLEHLPHWVDALDHWSSRLKSGGTLFLYLPHRSQEYWKPWNNRKHVHIFDEEMIRAYLTDTGYTKVYVSGVDLNNAFMAMAEKV